MKSQKPTPGKGGASRRLTFVVFAVAVITAACSYGYSAWAENKRQEALLPRLKLNSLVRDMRTFEGVAGRLPVSFDEIEERVWKHTGQKPTFDKDGRAYTFGYYLYVLSPRSDNTASVWAVPVGPRREEASSHFVVIGPEGLAHWKGAAIAPEAFDRLEPDPVVGELAALGLVRQPDEIEGARKERRKELRTPSTRDRR